MTTANLPLSHGCCASQRWKDTVLGAALLIIVPLALYPELIFGAYALTRMDLGWAQYPLRVLNGQMWRAGQWPLWNPYVLGGFPLLAEGVAGVLHPFNVLFALPLPPYMALNLLVVIHVGLAALFTYGLARSWRMGRTGAVLAALSYAGGGVMAAQITNLCIMLALAWIPLVLCLVSHATDARGASSRRSLGWATLGGAALALEVLDAQPQIVFFTLLLLAVYALYETVRRLVGMPSAPDEHSERSKHRQEQDHVRRASNGAAGVCRTDTWYWPFAATGVTIIVGLALSAPQLLPTAELWRESVRSAGIAYSQITLQSLHPLQLLELIVPNIFGNPVVSYSGLDSFDELFAYVGLIPLALAFVSWRRWRDPRVPFLFLVLAASLWLSLGGHTPIYGVLQHVPGFNVFRIPARWLVIVSLALALLAGFGLDELLRDPRVARALAWRLGLLGLLGLISALLVVLYRGPALEWVSQHETDPETRQLLVAALRRFLLPQEPSSENWLPRLLPMLTTVPGALTLVQLAAAQGVLTAYYVDRRIHRYAMTISLVALTCLDLLASSGSTVLYLKSPSYWQFDSAAVALVRQTTGDDRAFGMDATTPEERKAHPDWAARLHQSVEWLQQHVPSIYHVASPLGNHASLRTQRYDDFLAHVPSQRASDMFSVRTLLTWGPLPSARAAHWHEASPALASTGGKTGINANDPLIHLYENPNVIPRAYWVGRVESVDDGPAAVEKIADPEFDPHSTVVIERSQDPARPTPIAATRPGPDLVPAAIREYASDRLRIEVDAPASGWLVLTDTWYPGWRATVDGQTTSISRANYLFRGVPVTAGPHSIEFWYWPVSFYAGLAISVATTALLALCGVAALRQRARVTCR